MTKYSFLDDYSEGCHPQILKALQETNRVQQTAYGQDSYSLDAKALIHAHLNRPGAEIFFVAGGTLANLTLMASALRPHEAVISAHSGHIATRETGAIEATGHKIISVPTQDGKLTPDLIEQSLNANSHYPHMAKPRMVYISNATETGRIYTKAELTALSKTCRNHDLLLFLDGARLGVALTADTADLTLADITSLTDMFWIGGTKAGALLGEAIIIPDPKWAQDFAFHIKQRGGLMAKGRVLGLQFLTLFTDDLYFAASKSANEQARTLSEALKTRGFAFADEAQTNQVFPIMPNNLIDRLKDDFTFYMWDARKDNHAVIRLVTSWATKPEHIKAFIHRLDTP